MTERLLLALVVIGALAVGGVLVRRLVARRVQDTISRVQLEPAADALARILVFSGPGCSACQAQQRIVDDLVREWPSPVSVHNVDAVAEPALAGRLGILIVPTTVVAAPDGQIVGFNGGLVDAARLARQLQTAA